MCVLIMDINNWLNNDLCNCNESGLQLMTLQVSCQKHMVGTSNYRKNKLCSHQKNNFLAMFWPKISPNKAVDDYHEHCKHALIKHKPWTGLRKTACGGDDEDKKE